MFDNCGDIEDRPLKRVIRSPAKYPKLPATTTGKRRYQATMHQDNVTIIDDNDEDNDDEKFVAKKQRVVSYGSTMSEDTQSHVQYSSASISKDIIIQGLH